VEHPSKFWLNDKAIGLTLLSRRIDEIRNVFEETLVGKEVLQLSQHTQKAFSDIQEVFRNVENALENARKSLAQLFWKGLPSRKLEYSIKAEHQRIAQMLVECEALAKQLLRDETPGILLGEGRTAAAQPNVGKRETAAFCDKIGFLSNELKFKLLQWCADLPEMTVPKLARLENQSPSEIVRSGLGGFVSDEGTNELVDTADRIAALAGRVRNIEPAKSLPKRPPGFRV
jgi:hypothetical protein